jgi:hypothetical protein
MPHKEWINMYNNEMKEGFIKDYMRSRVVAKTSLYSLFKKVEPYEEKLDKDCSRFTKEDVLKMFEEFRAKSVYVLLNYNTILKAYCAWMKYYHGLENQIAYEDITIDLLRPFIAKNANNILSREDITDIEEQAYNWTDKAIVECLWEGLSGNSMRDLVGIEERMINHESKQLRLPDGRVFDLTDRLYQLLIQAFNENEYLCYGKTLKVKILEGTGRLYKERDNAYAMDTDDKFFRWVYRKIMNLRKHVDIPGLTMKNITISGMCHYLKEGMDETGLDLKSFLRTEMGEKLMDKYGYVSEFRADNVAHRYAPLL